MFNKCKIIYWRFDCTRNITELSFITSYGGKRLADRLLSRENIQMLAEKMQVCPSMQ